MAVRGRTVSAADRPVTAQKGRGRLNAKASTIAAPLEIEPLGEDRAALPRSLANRLVYSIRKDPITATKVLYPDDTTDNGRAAAEAAILLRLRVAPGHPAALSRLSPPSRRPTRHGRYPTQRHTPLHRDSGLDARAARRAPPRLGAHLGHHAPHLFIYQPHADAGGN